MKKNKASNLVLMKEAFKNQKVRVNFCVFLFYWFAQVLTYIGLPIELESVGGNLFVNLAIFALLELLGSLIASELSLKYEFLPTFKLFLNITIVLFFLFFFFPSNLQEQNHYVITFFIIDSFCAKLAYDTSWHLVGMHLPNLFTYRFYGQYLIVAVSISRFSLIFLPYLNYLPRSFGIHPFALYGIFWLFSRILLRYAEIVVQKSKAITQNSFCEMKSGVISQMQIIYHGENIDKLVIKRENKLQKFVELKEGLISPLNSDNKDYKETIPNIDQIMGQERRTLVFEGFELPEIVKDEKKIEKKIENNGTVEEVGNFPTIVRKNVKPFKRRMSNMEVAKIIKSENPIGDEKKNIYGNESPMLKDLICEENNEEGKK